MNRTTRRVAVLRTQYHFSETMSSKKMNEKTCTEDENYIDAIDLVQRFETSKAYYCCICLRNDEDIELVVPKNTMAIVQLLGLTQFQQRSRQWLACMWCEARARTALRVMQAIDRAAQVHNIQTIKHAQSSKRQSVNRSFSKLRPARIRQAEVLIVASDMTEDITVKPCTKDSQPETLPTWHQNAETIILDDDEDDIIILPDRNKNDTPNISTQNTYNTRNNKNTTNTNTDNSMASIEKLTTNIDSQKSISNSEKSISVYPIESLPKSGRDQPQPVHLIGVNLQDNNIINQSLVTNPAPLVIQNGNNLILVLEDDAVNKIKNNNLTTLLQGNSVTGNLTLDNNVILGNVVTNGISLPQSNTLTQGNIVTLGNTLTQTNILSLGNTLTVGNSLTQGNILPQVTSTDTNILINNDVIVKEYKRRKLRDSENDLNICISNVIGANDVMSKSGVNLSASGVNQSGSGGNRRKSRVNRSGSERNRGGSGLNRSGSEIKREESEQWVEKAPIRTDDRVDWEDEIPMDVISFVDATDPHAKELLKT